MSAPIFELENLTVEFRSPAETVRAADGLSLEVRRGETFAIVGESGSGKTVSMMAALRLLPVPPAHVEADAIRFDGQDIQSLPARAWRRISGDRIAMVFQDALTSLNPVYSVGWQIAEMFRLHRPQMDKSAIRTRVIEILGEVGIPDPASRADDYPHQFSGGMRQRAMIAMGIALEPELLIADEPTTALDVTVEAQIMDLLRNLRERHEMAMVLITHDLGLVAENADRVAIMYAGRVMETGAVADILAHPRHPYTRGLLAARPQAGTKGRSLRSIPGSPPNLAKPPVGCPFHPRCPLAAPLCRQEKPVLRETPAGTACCLPRRPSGCTGRPVPQPGRGGLRVTDRVGPLLEVEELVKHFEIRSRSLFGRPKIVRAVDGVSFYPGAQRDARRGRRVGLRQVHAGAHAPAAGDAQFGPRHLRRPRALRGRRRRVTARSTAASRSSSRTRLLRSTRACRSRRS